MHVTASHTKTPHPADVFIHMANWFIFGVGTLFSSIPSLVCLRILYQKMDVNWTNFLLSGRTVILSTLKNEEKSQQIIQPSWFSLFCCHMLLLNCANQCVNAGSIFKGASNSKGFPELNNTSGSEAALKSSTSNELNGECETNWDLSQQEEEESECGHEKMSSQATADDQEGDE